MNHNRACPSCGSVTRVNEIASSPPAEECDWTTLQKSWSGFFKKKVFFTYSRCTCGLLFAKSYFDSAELQRLYSSMADNTAGLGAEQTSPTQVGYVDMIDSGGPSGDYLELGPDIGLFTATFAQRFDPQQQRKYWLIEPNRDVHQELARRISGYRIEVDADESALDRVPDGSLATVVMIHVLDHLLNPVDLLTRIRKKMIPGGRVYIVTHNERSAIARVLRSRWPAYCLQHPHLFNPGSMKRMLARSRFETKSVRRTANHFPLFYLVRHGFYAVGWSANFLGPLRGPNLPLRLGNIMTCAVAV